MRAFLFGCLAALLLSSCALIDSAKSIAKSADDILSAAREFKSGFVAAKAEADTNKDGKTSVQEWWQYLLLILGIGTPVAGAGVMVRNARSNADKDVRFSKAETEIEVVKNALRNAGFAAPEKTAGISGVPRTGSVAHPRGK